jgi:hypothetical protein
LFSLKAVLEPSLDYRGDNVPGGIPSFKRNASNGKTKPVTPRSSARRHDVVLIVATSMKM